jgi:hypothetical protein
VHQLNTVYQFWIHTKSVGKLPGVVEWLLNTPSHHRVHHDRRVHKNYAAIFIVWDRFLPLLAAKIPASFCIFLYFMVVFLFSFNVEQNFRNVRP